MKLCKKCGIEKPESLFYKNCKGYYVTPCKECKKKIFAPLRKVWTSKHGLERAKICKPHFDKVILDMEQDYDS